MDRNGEYFQNEKLKCSRHAIPFHTGLTKSLSAWLRILCEWYSRSVMFVVYLVESIDCSSKYEKTASIKLFSRIITLIWQPETFPTPSNTPNTTLLTLINKGDMIIIVLPLIYQRQNKLWSLIKSSVFFMSDLCWTKKFISWLLVPNLLSVTTSCSNFEDKIKYKGMKYICEEKNRFPKKILGIALYILFQI